MMQPLLAGLRYRVPGKIFFTLNWDPDLVAWHRPQLII